MMLRTTRRGRTQPSCSWEAGPPLRRFSRQRGLRVRKDRWVDEVRRRSRHQSACLCCADGRKLHGHHFHRDWAFTTTSGSIFQTFRVTQGQTTLTVKWNFLSEEFLEYIGSTYQDYFNVVVKDANGVENVLSDQPLMPWQPNLARRRPIRERLISVSPDIVFDRGGVYITGWQTSTFNISQYAGQRITLILRAGDVGDSIYDTAILLDDIAVN